MPRGTVSPASGRLRIPAGSQWLSGALLLVTDVAAGLTAFGGFLRGPPEMMGSARGTAIVQLVVTGPVLAVAMVATVGREILTCTDPTGLPYKSRTRVRTPVDL